MLRSGVASRTASAGKTSVNLVAKRYAGGGNVEQETIPRLKRPEKKIPIGLSRPPVYPLINGYIELSDGSVIKRRTQIPKDEIRMILDQRNHPLWNPARKDLEVADASLSSKTAKFRQRYSIFDFEAPKKVAEDGEPVEAPAAEAETKEAKVEASETEGKADENIEYDEYLDIFGDNFNEVQTGGKIYVKPKPQKKKKERK